MTEIEFEMTLEWLAVECGAFWVGWLWLKGWGSGLTNKCQGGITHTHTHTHIHRRTHAHGQAAKTNEWIPGLCDSKLAPFTSDPCGKIENVVCALWAELCGGVVAVWWGKGYNPLERNDKRSKIHYVLMQSPC